MTTSPQYVITAGRAYVRIIESADALLGYRGALPPQVSAEILALPRSALPAARLGQTRRIAGTD